MNRYSPLLPDKVRQLPSQFSWLDQRLAREHYFLRASADAWMLYLFLVTVSDARGLSFYADPTICDAFNWESARLACARKELCTLSLVAFRRPVYQVLELPSGTETHARNRLNGHLSPTNRSPQLIAAILQGLPQTRKRP